MLSVMTISDLCILSFMHNVVQKVFKVLKKHLFNVFVHDINHHNNELNSFLYLLVVAV